MRKRQVHELKVDLDYYEPLISCRKNFEVRRNDRDFAEGDLLFLREWDSGRHAYTNLEAIAQVGYVYDGTLGGIEEGFIAFSVEQICTLSDEWSEEYAAAVERSSEEPAP